METTTNEVDTNKIIDNSKTIPNKYKKGLKRLINKKPIKITKPLKVKDIVIKDVKVKEIKKAKVNIPAIKKPNKPVFVMKQKKSSISRIVFKFITNKKLLESDNRKAFYPELLELIKKDFPESKFHETHFYWYVSRYIKQANLGLALDHIDSRQVEK